MAKRSAVGTLARPRAAVWVGADVAGARAGAVAAHAVKRGRTWSWTRFDADPTFYWLICF